MKNFFALILLLLSVGAVAQSVISGTVFYDNNGNNIFDAGDSPASNGTARVDAILPLNTRAHYKTISIS